MRQYVTMECTVCHGENYRTEVETRGGERMELKKHCPRCRKHTVHKQTRK